MQSAEESTKRKSPFEKKYSNKIFLHCPPGIGHLVVAIPGWELEQIKSAARISVVHGQNVCPLSSVYLG